jgi:MscS family membrane protein
MQLHGEIIMKELLQQTFLNNTLETWVVAIGIIIASLILGKVGYWFFSSIMRRLTKRTKTKIDDIIIDMIEEPVVFSVVAAGVWFGLKQLTLPEAVINGINISFQFLLVLLVAWFAARLFDAICKEYLVAMVEASESDLDDQLLPIIRKTVKTIIWALAIIVALNNAGYNVGALIAGLGIGGLALAMAAKDTISNIFGGVTVFTDQPFKINDRIKIDGFDGTVKEVGVRSTRLQTLEGRIVTIPNSKFAGSSVENISREPSRKIVLNLGLTYDTTPEKMQQAMDLLKQIGDNSQNTEDKLIISFNGFGDFAMNIMFIYYIRPEADIANTQTEINMEILSQFNANGLEFAFPTQTIYTMGASA